jgi:glycosyltransferase involved in cell wall biosynthesis
MAAADTAAMTAPSLHIALITETFAPEVNGVANTLSRLCDGLRASGHHIQLVRPRQGQEGSLNSAEQILVRGWPIPGYPGLQWGQGALSKLLRNWQRQRPDVLYIATEGPLGLSALRAARRLQIPVVSGFHTNFQQYTAHYGAGLLSRALTSYLRWFHHRTHVTLVPSHTQRLELQRRGFHNLALLSRGVDSQLFHPAKRSDALRREWGLSPDDVAIVHVGRLAAEKNLDLLAQSFAALQQAHPGQRLTLIVVGDGPQRAKLTQQLPEARFCGVRRGEELASHYASGDVFLFPSLSETFGNVVLEAMASGLAVVAYDQAAAAQHIQHGHNGALAEGGDERGFIDAASWLLSDAPTLRRVRLNARQHAAQQGWPAIIGAFEQHLHTACASAPDTPLARLPEHR